jgi:endonuclease YncB( thermonuclease family)
MRLLRLFILTAAGLYGQDFTGKVVGITDGDTIRVMHDGSAQKIRLWGIDCLESKQPFGTRAKQFTGGLASGKVVNVRVRDRDRYHRTVAEVILPDGRNLNREFVRAGLAWWYQRYARHETILQGLERKPGRPAAAYGWIRIQCRRGSGGRRPHPKSV